MRCSCWRRCTRSTAVRSRAGAAASGALRLLAAVSLQAVLGILTLLNQVPIDLALVASGGRDRGADACGDAGGAAGLAAIRAGAAAGVAVAGVGQAG